MGSTTETAPAGNRGLTHQSDATGKGAGSMIATSRAIRAIPTTYAGCRFRSRLEARWAVFFDHLGITWEYEAEGYEGPAGRYLPDFLVHLGEPTLFEVKPLSEAGQTDARWWEASAAADARLIVAYGMPRGDGHAPWDAPTPDGHLNLIDGRSGLEGWDNYHAFCTCPWCGTVGIEFDGRGARVCGYAAHDLTSAQAEKQVGHYDKAYSYDDPRIVSAYTAARSARFEHGERG